MQPWGQGDRPPHTVQLHGAFRARCNDMLVFSFTYLISCPEGLRGKASQRIHGMSVRTLSQWPFQVPMALLVPVIVSVTEHSTLKAGSQTGVGHT